MRFMEGSDGNGERERRRREDKVFERATMAEVYFTRDCKIEERVAHPFDSGVDEGSLKCETCEEV